MSRTIKFRARHEGTGSWFYGVNQTEPIEDRRILSLSGFWGEILHGKLDPKTLGQYTGLKDKNGVEIYEGDILQSTSTFVSWGTGLPTGQGDCVETFEVFYIEYEARFTLKAINAQRHRGHVSSFSISQSQITKYCEVIGNIYEGLHSGEKCDIIEEWKKNISEQSQSPSKDTRLQKKQDKKLA